MKDGLMSLWCVFLIMSQLVCRGNTGCNNNVSSYESDVAEVLDHDNVDMTTSLQLNCWE